MPSSMSTKIMSSSSGAEDNNLQQIKRNFSEETISINDYLSEKPQHAVEESEDDDGLLVADSIPPRCSSAPPVSETSPSTAVASAHRRFSSRIRFPTKRRLSSLVAGSSSIFKKESASMNNNNNNNTEMMKHQTSSETLHQIIRDSEKRSILISKLISQRSDCTVRVRLIAAVDEYERTTDRAQQRLKGFKIISMFVSMESMFHIYGIPAGLEQALLQFKLNRLVDLRSHVLECLAQHDIVAKAMNNLASN